MGRRIAGGGEGVSRHNRTSSACVRNPGDTEISQSTRDLVGHDVPNQVGPDGHIAHITFTTLDDLKVIEAEPFGTFS